ncbi:MAG TPA: DHA2 family efflux MFS transporter permease subunit [Syntrophales bacterium]|nr:DHA2 family efflux MFS transporter permease subunit [Syntrophales bacterium]
MDSQPNKWMVALTVMLPTLMVIVDTSVVNVSLDHIRGSLSAGIDESTWSITSYLAANAIVIPISGWLSRLLGRKRLLILSVALFTLSSFLCGLAWSIQSLVVFRVLQGLSGGTLQPISQSILLETFPPSQHGTAMAIFGIGIMFGPIIGPFLGGWITDNWSWHWIFFINIPVGAVSILMSLFFIMDPAYLRGMKMKIDYWGLVFLGVGIGCLQIMLDKGQREDWFASDFITWLCVACVMSLLIFVITELVTEHPIVDLRILKDFSFSLGNIIVFFVYVSLFGSIVLLPIYLQSLMGYTSTLAGLVLAPGGVASLMIMPIVGLLITRINSKGIVIAGIFVTAFSTYLMSMFNRLADFNTIVWPRIIMGVGVGLIIIPLTTLTLSRMKKEQMGNATSIFNLVRNIGGSFGVAISTTILTRRAQFHQARLIDHLTPFDMSYTVGSSQASQVLQHRGLEPGVAGQGGLAAIYEEVMREASMMSFNDVFYLLSVMLVLTVPLVFFMQRIYHDAADDKNH